MATLIGEIKAWFALRIKKQLMKERVRLYVNIMAACLIAGTRLVQI